MKKHLLNQVAALCLLAPAAASLVAIPATAQAQRAAPALQTHALEVNADSGLAPGSQLRLRLEGTPGARATARIPGANVDLALREVAPGEYSGRYTVRRSDRIDPTSMIRVSLAKGKRMVITNYSFPPSFMPPVAAAAPPTVIVQAPPVQVLRIDRFVAAPVGRLEPGTELVFRLHGMPGATASFDIPGVVANVPMRELRPGRYEGTYTVRRQDNLNPSAQVTATLRSDDNRVVTATLSQPLVADNRAPSIRNASPRQGESVDSRQALVSATFDDAGGTGVDPDSVRITISGRDVTSLAEVTPRHFNYRGSLPPGRHTVDVTAKDRVGNVAQQSWSFDVGSSVSGAPSAVLPLMVMSHPANGQIDPAMTTVRGRTAPYASVRVRVDAVPPVVRGNAGVARQLLSEVLQADANGDFSFTFNPRHNLENSSVLPIPGTRYDVSISANRDNQVVESKLTLYQRS